MKNAMRLICLTACLFIAACGGGSDELHTELLPKSNQVQPGDVDGSLPSIAALDVLAQNSRQLSVTGPGWYPLWHENITASAAMTTGSNTSLSLDSSAGNAFVIYSVGGFTGDFSPTSMRNMLASGAQPPYFLMAANYESGRWQPVGPLSGNFTGELPGLEDATFLPADYISPAGNVHLAMLLPEGNGSLGLQRIDLGIDGGILGPAPPSRIGNSGFGDGITVFWRHSPDYASPDFAGYIVEGQQVPGGEFSQLASTEPLQTSAVIPGVPILYAARVAAVDVSGNRSEWAYRIDSGGLAVGREIMQVEVDMPRGPLYGPVEVQFDMSDSSTPGSNPVAEYNIEFDDSSLDYSGADPVASRLLQPGCYEIHFMVNDGSGFGADYGQTTRRLVVYPRWDDTDIVVREADTSIISDRFIGINGGIDPDSGEHVVACTDLSVPATVIRRGQPGNYEFQTVPFLGDFSDVYSDPAFLNGTAYFGVRSSARPPYVIASNADGARIITGSLLLRQIVPVSTGDRLFLINNGGSVITIQEFGALPGATPIAGPLTDCEYMDACWNPAENTIMIAFEDADSLSYIAIDIDSLVATDDDSGLLSPLTNGIEIEVDNATGRACIISRSTDGRISYLRRDTGAFSAPIQPEPAVNNFWPADLAWIDGEPYCAFASDFGQANIYELGSSSAVNVNVIDYSIDSLYAGFMLPQTSSCILYDRIVGATLVVSELGLDDTETELDRIDSNAGWGFWMDAAQGSSEYHLLMKDAALNQLVHLTSVDGNSWTADAPLNNVSYADLYSNEAGEVFRSLRNVSGYDVSYWNGSAWDNRFSRSGTQVYEAISQSNVSPLNTGWLLHDSVTDNLFRATGEASGFTTGTDAFPESQTILKGRLLHSGLGGPGGYSDAFCLYANPSTSASFGMLDAFEASIVRITGFADNPTTISDLDQFNAEHTTGRTMETMGYRSSAGRFDQMSQACWSVNGYNGNAFRYTFKPTDGIPLDAGLQALPFANHQWMSEDVRRTVSAAQANGLTAVAVMCSLEGKHSYMEWSCFGNWEELPLPQGITRMADAELLVDDSGRWNLFWRDPVSGRVLCRRTGS